MQPRATRISRYVPRSAAEWHLHTSDLWREIDGTLCYVDISGFTALSEKLARHGRIGAEELTEVLSLVFGRMLDAVYERGGRLLKFGGDALLLMFTEAEHPIHACSAAVEMQSVLRHASDVDTSAGRLRLKMSVGVHSGTIHLFRVGGSHKELIVTGPAASVTTEMEETAEAGDIVVSSATRAALPRDSATTKKGTGWLLAWRRPRLDHPGWRSRVELPDDAITVGVPVALRDHLDVGPTEPEHHVATVGFVNYRGVDALMASRGPEALATALDELVRNVQEAVDAEGVTFLASDVDEDGGKIILVAGVPGVQQDDEGRTLRAARRIVDRAGTLPVSIGINRGHVYVGEIGTDIRATYTIMGDTVNLAARLMAAAPSGAIYASPSALDRSRTLFESIPLEPFPVKGKEGLIQAYGVGTETGSRPTDTGELPFVGRAAELAALQAMGEDLFAGLGGAVTVVGERGAGKSRLVDEVLPFLDGAAHLEIRAEPYGVRTPYRALRDPVRRLLGVDRDTQPVMADRLEASLASMAPDRLPLLPLVADLAMIDVPSTPAVDEIELRFRQDRAADLLVELVARIHPGPVIFEVEDGHYMDPAAASVLHRIARSTREHPWLVITTRRDSPDGFDPRMEQIELQPLADEDARDLVLGATAGAPLRTDEIETIVQRAGGLPLFLEELIAAMRQTGGLEALPDTLDAVISAQIDALPPLTRRILRFSSVLGRSFRVETANQLLEDEGVALDHATRAQLSGFLTSEGRDRLHFRHAVIRDVAYEGLSYRRRRELHLRVGEAAERSAGSERESVADILSLHFALGHDHRRAWSYARVAGDQARKAFANMEAAGHYRRALGSAGRLTSVEDAERADVLISLGDVTELAGRYEDALDAYRRASRLVGDDEPLRRAELLLKRARVRRRSASYAAALREASQGLRLVADDPGPEAVRARARLGAERGAIRRWQQRPREALEHAESAARDARSVDDLETLALALDLIDWAHRMMGQTEEPVHYTEALEIFEQIGDLSGAAQVLNNLGAEAFWEGRWRDAIDAYTRSRDAELRTGNDVQAAISSANIAELLINQQRLDDAEPLLTEAIRILTASGHTPAAIFAETELARLLIRRGEYERAETHLADIRDRARDVGEPMSELYAILQMADSKLRSGHASDALDLMLRAERDASAFAEPFLPTITRLTGGALAELGRYDEARARIDDGLAHAEQQGLRFDRALLLEAKTGIISGSGGDPDPRDVATASRLFDEMEIRRTTTPLT